MSWTQGVQLRADLPQHFIDFADKQCDKGTLNCIVWDTAEPNLVHLHYYDESERLVEIKTFRLKT